MRIFGSFSNEVIFLDNLTWPISILSSFYPVQLAMSDVEIVEEAGDLSESGNANSNSNATNSQAFSLDQHDVELDYEPEDEEDAPKNDLEMEKVCGWTRMRMKNVEGIQKLDFCGRFLTVKKMKTILMTRKSLIYL